MATSKSETDVLDTLVQWAERHPLVRALLLESSRASDRAAIDALSDYDVLIVATDTRPFVDESNWLNTFGAPLVKFRSTKSVQGSDTSTCLVLYTDHTKIDFLIWPVGLLDQIAQRQELPDVLDWGYSVLLDKDELTKKLPPPTRTAYIPSRPTSDKYQSLVNEFWWESTYVAKALWRDDLMLAKYSLEVVMKLDLLRRMLEWSIEIDHDWSWKPGVLGRGLKRSLSPDVWSAFERTFAGADIDENWEALFATIELFRQVASEVGRALGYVYSQELDRDVSAYLQEIRALPR